jgi:hypothetical protein
LHLYTRSLSCSTGETFRFVPPGEDVLSDPSPRAAAARCAAALLRELLALHGRGPVRVTDAAGGLACLVLVWPADSRMPTARAERRQAGKTGGRVRCREDVLAVVRAAGRPLTRKEVVRALREVGNDHGAGTVAKALADLTAAGTLVNLRDKRGYRLRDWPRPDQTPSLFH